MDFTGIFDIALPVLGAILAWEGLKGFYRWAKERLKPKKIGQHFELAADSLEDVEEILDRHGLNKANVVIRPLRKFMDETGDVFTTFGIAIEDNNLNGPELRNLILKEGKEMVIAGKDVVAVLIPKKKALKSKK